MPVDTQTYRRRINAWALYDWANSAFFTTVLAAVLPSYYSAVAGATLPSPAIATQYWSLGLSLALFVSAVMAPILGTISDVVRGKKRLLAIFLAIGVIASGLLVLVGTGDWLLASVLIVIGRIGAAGANVFYDALLPHVAREEDQDAVSTRGFALGYLGGGILLAINIAMFNVIDDAWFPFPFEFSGIRLSFVSVALWWAVFSLPLFRIIPEPESAAQRLKHGQTVLGASFQRLRDTFRDLRGYRELFRYLIAFLIYNDGIGTIIGVAVIYGAELGFETTELVAILLLVQFVGIPFSFIFGSLPSAAAHRRHLYLAYILFNVLILPAVGIATREVLDTPPSLPQILSMLTVIQAAAAAFALLGGGRLVKPLADTLNTKRSILLSLLVYAVISVWGYFLTAVVEFWFLAWMVGIVQGGSQALSRSLYASMAPAAKSGEFFGLFSVMSKFSAITGPLLFAGAVALFGNSRPAILSLVLLFALGGGLLLRVDVEAGRRHALEENRRSLAQSA